MRNKDREASGQASNNAHFSRRNMLLGGTTFAAVSALASAAPVRTAQAQRAAQAAAGANRRRQGRTSSSSSATTSARPTSAPTRSADGLPHAEHRPHRPRRHDVHRLLRRAELHGGPLDVHHRTVRRCAPASPRSVSRAPPLGLQARGPDHRRAAQAARLRHRPVRQEPSRRPQRVPADGARLRRVLRQSLSPQRRGRAGELLDYPKDPGFRARSSARAACCAAGRRERDDPTERAALRAGSAGRPSRTPAR